MQIYGKMGSGVQVFLIVIFSAPFAIQGSSTNSTDLEFYEKVRLPNEKLTQLVFYYDPQGQGALPVANAPNVTVQPNLFGLVVVVDYKLTAGPNLTGSEHVGQGQGFFTSSSTSSFSLFTALNIVLTGNYMNSSLTIIGYDPTIPDSRELTVIGGTGVFRMARGSALFTSITRNTTTNMTNVLKATVTVLHY